MYVFPAQTLAVVPENFQTTQVIGAGLDGPSGFEIAPDGRIFVLERTGAIKVVKDGVLLPEPFAVLPTVASGDRGLIGIAFDPAFGVTNHHVYFYYTDTNLLNRLVRFDASTDIGTNGPFLIYQTTSPSQELHVGGSVQFGPDGKLYFAVGDNGYPPNAQNLGNPHGKILRINKDGSIPFDNPFVLTSGAQPEIWAYGMRNPWRFQFDSGTGYMYGGDVGDYTWEEVNRIQKGGNYGWPTYEGLCFTLCGNIINPIHAYNHNGESAAITGGPVYRGTLFPEEYQGNLFFGDYAQGVIRRVTLDANGDSTGVFDFDPNAGSVVDLKVHDDGSLYYITYWPGRLYKITYTTDNHAPSANATSDIDKGVEPLTVAFSSEGSSDPDEDQITFLWRLGDGTQSTEVNPVKTYTQKGTYTVELSVSDGVNVSNAIPLVIQVGIPPTVNIGEPSDGSTYKAGDTIHWTASSLDGAGFDIDDRDISTEIIFHHHTHIHPFLGPIIGRQGTFTIPDTGEASPDTWYEIKVTATDTNGLSTTKSSFIYPQKSQITIETSVPGLKVLLDGSPIQTPATMESVISFKRELSAPTVQELNGVYYQFDHWSDSGAPTHVITTPETDTTYTAVYSLATSYTGEYFDNNNLAGLPVITRQDATIDFVWGAGSPDPLLPVDNFSARWQKTQYFAGGRYKFITATDDGVRLFVDGVKVIDEWHGNNGSFSAVLDLTVGNHTIVMEYMEMSVLAHAKLEYELTPDQPLPPSVFAGEYFANKTLTGVPSLVRDDQAINFDWGGGSPDLLIPNDNFSVRWTKSETFEIGTYEFTVIADDGVRLMIDGQLVLDKWIDQAPTTYKVQKNLTAGNHTIVMEYFESGVGAIAKMSYAEVVDTTPLPGSFTGTYFSNKTLTGAPVVTRNDQAINFDWGGGSPDPLISNDNFSARWTKTETFLEGTYEFTATGDDGIRIFVDGFLILDKWIDQAPSTFKVQKQLAAGEHTIVFEYYEAGGGAVAKMNYAKVADTVPTDGYTAEYFNNDRLIAPVTLTRTDVTVDFDWGGGSPDPLINANNFSARWTKTVAFEAGTYQFAITGDDGIRVLVDGVAILDKWIDQPPTTYTVSKDLTVGNHTIVIEYYEAGGGAVAKVSYEKLPDNPVPPTNLVLNGSFEIVNGNWASNWTRDITNAISIDTTSKGNDGVNSLNITPNQQYGHIFNDTIILPDTTSTYHWTQYINTLNGVGEFGFYIDEYDANGNWISGQWKGMIITMFTGVKDITYIPTSPQVHSIGLQYYVVPDSTFNLYLDSVTFGK